MIARWLPAPSLSIALFVVWLLLNQSLDAATLLLHVFDLQDEQGMIRMIKDRYEKPLMEIFES